VEAAPGIHGSATRAGMYSTVEETGAVIKSRSILTAKPRRMKASKC
jgi:hypothetical protein